MNDYRKTDVARTNTYTYTSLTGSKCTLYPESLLGKLSLPLAEDSEGCITHAFVPDWIIADLHRADNRIVYNNLKNSRKKLTDKEKQAIHEWEEAHPNEKYTGHWHLRLDGPVLSDLDTDIDADKSHVQKYISEFRLEEESDLIIDRLREIVSSFPSDWKELYEMVLLQGIPMTAVAKLQGVTESAVRKKVNKIRSRIASDEILCSFF